jgi:prepilin-type N-terminal cleavage/methylation domain-containing protein
MNRASHSPRSAFTLVEILVVISIILLLMGLLVPMIAGILRRSREKAAETSIDLLTAALHQYQMEYNDFPPDNFPTADTSEALFYHLCRSFQKGERTIGPFLGNSSIYMKDKDGNGYCELYSPLYGKYSYCALKNAAGQPWGFLLVDPGADQRLGGSLDPLTGFTPDASGDSKDNLYRKGRP